MPKHAFHQLVTETPCKECGGMMEVRTVKEFCDRCYIIRRQRLKCGTPDRTPEQWKDYYLSRPIGLPSSKIPKTKICCICGQEFIYYYAKRVICQQCQSAKFKRMHTAEDSMYRPAYLKHEKNITGIKRGDSPLLA